MSATAFFVGSGFIGGTVIQSFLADKQFDRYSNIYVLARDLKKAPVLEALSPRIKVVKGELGSFDVLKETSLKSDLVIHTATADDLPSVKAIIAGLEARPAGKPEAIYIHTSGTGLLMDDGASLAPATKIYSDSTPDDVDSLPDSAPHRDVDLFIKAAAIDNKTLAGKAKVVVIAPPLIYGIGTGSSNTASIQLPGWIRESLQKKKVQVIGEGKAVWNNIHVRTLATAYLRIISYLESEPSQPSNLYFFAETSEHTWGDLGVALHASLEKKGICDAGLEYISLEQAKKNDEETDQQGSWVLGTNSRSRADRLKALGWKGDAELGEKVPTLFESVDAEVDEALKAAKKA